MSPAACRTPFRPPVRPSLLLAVLLAFALPGLAGAQGAAPAADRSRQIAELDAAIARAVAEWEVPGLAVAVVLDGEVVLAKGYGVRELGRPGAVDADTLFAVGSTTKAMTAALLGQLADEGRLGWDDPVIRHLPGFRVADPWVTRELTVRDLLTHRGGLPNTDLLWYGAERSRADLVAALAQVPAAYSLRSGFVYQNLMYVTAGELAAAVAGSPWESLLATRLLAPLGMARTVPTLAETIGRDNVAAPHDLDRNDRSPRSQADGRLRVIDNMAVDAAAPAGAVWSSVNDMSRWLRLLLAEGSWEGRQVLSQAAVAELFRPQTVIPADQFYPTAALTRPHWTTYGLGWFQQDFQGRMVQYHTGSIDGMSAIVGLVPEEELGLVVLANRDHAELRHALLWQILDRLGPQPSGRDWNAEVKKLYADRQSEADKARGEAEAQQVAGTRPTLPLARYAGVYRHPLYGDARIVPEDPSGGGLRLVFGPGLQGRLEHWHYDTFRVRWDRAWQAPELLTFGLDAAGKPARLELFGEELRRVEEGEKPAAAP